MTTNHTDNTPGRGRPGHSQATKDAKQAEAAINAAQRFESLLTEKKVTPLLLNTKTVCFLLGEISTRSIRRLELNGKLRPVRLLRHKLYAAADVQKLVEEELSWKA